MKTTGKGTVSVMTPQGEKQFKGEIGIYNYDAETCVEVDLHKQNPNEGGSTKITVALRNAIVYWAD